MIRLTPPTRLRRVSSGWGASRAYRGGWHAGLDFHAPKGDPMLAAAPGIIDRVVSTPVENAGKYIVIDHGGGIYTRYLHADRLSRRVGERVGRGDVIGLVGDTGAASSGAHVHFDVKMKPTPLAEYARLFGVPTTGFSAAMSWGQGVPAEALMDNAIYEPGVVQASLARGVTFYQGGGLLVPLLVAAGAGWLLYRYVF